LLGARRDGHAPPASATAAAARESAVPAARHHPVDLDRWVIRVRWVPHVGVEVPGTGRGGPGGDGRRLVDDPGGMLKQLTYVEAEWFSR